MHAAQHDGAVRQRLHRRVVRRRLDGQLHGQRHLEHVARLPAPPHRDPAARAGSRQVAQRSAVERDHREGRPLGHPDPQRQGGGAGHHGQADGRVVGEPGVLPQDQACDPHLGRDVQVDVQAVRVAAVDGVGELGLGFHAGGGVAGEGVPVGGVDVRVALGEVVERLALERGGRQAGVVAVEAVR